jgi:hypothetical protein
VTLIFVQIGPIKCLHLKKLIRTLSIGTTSQNTNFIKVQNVRNHFYIFSIFKEIHKKTISDSVQCSISTVELVS